MIVLYVGCKNRHRSIQNKMELQKETLYSMPGSYICSILASPMDRKK